MSEGSSLAAWIVAGGGGTILGGLITAIIQTLGGRGRARADAADITVNAASKIMDRLTAENTRMREAIILLTEVLDEVIDDLDAPAATKAKLRRANRQAKMSAV